MSKALIIGDTPGLKKQLSDGIFEEQHYIQYAGKAEEAMEKFRSLKPNIVLFDTKFQEDERWDLLRRLKREAPNVPVLIVSALENFSNDPLIDEADGYAIKDIHPGMIRKKIQEASSHSAEDRSPNLKELKAILELYNADIVELNTRSKSMGSRKKDEYWRAMEALLEKKNWIEQDIMDFEMIGESGWEDFSEEIEQAFETLDKDYRKILTLFS
jgi:DNA-binding response OmpR family regulator